MNIRFKELLEIPVFHGFYEDACDDLRFVIPPETARLLRGGRMLAREDSAKLTVLHEVRADGSPVLGMANCVLRFGLVAIAPRFFNVTAPDSLPPPEAGALLFSNAGSPTELLVAPVTLTGKILSHPVKSQGSPVTLNLKDSVGSLLGSQTVTDNVPGTVASWDVSRLGTGRYEVWEGSTGISSSYYHDPDLARAGAFAILEVTINGQFYDTNTQTVSLPVLLEPRSQYLRYIVVTPGPNADTQGMAILDTAKSEPIPFDAITADARIAMGIEPEALGIRNASQVVVFQSRSPVPRSQMARKGIQLRKGTDVLIPHLPQPGPDRPDADMIISIPKP